MFFASNIKFLRKRKKKTQDDVALALGMKRSTLSGYENEVAMPGIPVLLSFSKYYNLSVDSLLKVDLANLSQQQMGLLENGEDIYLRGSKIRILATSVDTNNNENIELVSQKAKAGYAQGFFDQGYISELPRFQLPFLPKDKKYRSFQVSGDSMLPIPDQAWVTCEFVHDWLSIKTGEAYMILTLDEGLVFKLAENKIRRHGRLNLISLNEEYPPYEIPISEVKEVWHFVHFISDELPSGINTQEMIGKALNAIQADVKHIRKRLGKKELKTIFQERL